MHTYSIGSLTRWCVVGGGAPHQRAAAAATAPSARSRQASSWMAFEKAKWIYLLEFISSSSSLHRPSRPATQSARLFFVHYITTAALDDKEQAGQAPSERPRTRRLFCRLGDCVSYTYTCVYLYNELESPCDKARHSGL